MRKIDVPKNYLLIGSLVGLALGFLIGAVAKQWSVESLFTLSSLLEPLGTLWINSLRMIVVPLLIAYIVVAVSKFNEVSSSVKVGGGAILIHTVLLAGGMLLMILIMPSLVSYFEVTPGIREALSAQTLDVPNVAERPQPSGFTDSIGYLLPSNLFAAAANEDILPLFIASLIFAFALTKVSDTNRSIIVNFFDAIIETLHILIGWILMAMPFAVFILVFEMAAQTGLELVTALLYFIFLFCALLIGVTLLLYLITPALGKVSITKFARAAAPAQVMAVGTRSSMVCLPALIEGAKEKLGLPDSVVGLVMPLAVSMFKINKVVSGPLKLFFLAHLYGVTLDPMGVFIFFLAYFPTSYSSPGIPSGGFFLTLPLYIALGIPIEGVVLLRTVDAIPDIFKTVANVTEDMSVAAIVARFSSVRSSVTESLANP